MWPQKQLQLWVTRQSSKSGEAVSFNKLMSLSFSFLYFLDLELAASFFFLNFSFYGKMCMSVLRVYFSTSACGLYKSVYVCALSTFLGGQEKESKLTVAYAKR